MTNWTIDAVNVIDDYQREGVGIKIDFSLPAFEDYSVPLLRILINRGTEYCGRMDQHDYQLYLTINDIDQTMTKAWSPQTNGVCKRFQKTILTEFYQITFRKKSLFDIGRVAERSRLMDGIP